MLRDGVTGTKSDEQQAAREGSAVWWSEETIDVMSLGPMMKGRYERAHGRARSWETA